jgi:DNA-binding LacI/PurR family transcriptional regulator
MAEAGIDVDPTWVAESTFGIPSGADAARILMSLDLRPTAVFAVFAVNDNTAVGALSAFELLGLSVPEDVALVDYDDSPVVRHLPTPLTSVRVPFDQIATAALELLDSGPHGAHPDGPSPAVLRQSPDRSRSGGRACRASLLHVGRTAEACSHHAES